MPIPIPLPASQAWLFDVDGTLTPPTGRMDESFRDWFVALARSNPVFLVTGGGYERMRYQVGDEVLDAVRACWCCLGNSEWRSHREVAFHDFELSSDARSFLERELQDSPYPVRTGGHFDARRGILNFSVVGRNASAEQRAQYLAWDRTSGERTALLARFRSAFPNLDAQVGGEISTDIFARGRDKSQVLERVGRPVRFFGDQMGPQGVDTPLARAIEQRRDGSQVFEVRHWRNTQALLQARVASGELRLR